MESMPRPIVAIEQAILAATAVAAAEEAVADGKRQIRTFGPLLAGIPDNDSPARVLIYIVDGQVTKLHVKCHARSVNISPTRSTYLSKATVQETGFSVTGKHFERISKSLNYAFLKLIKEIDKRAATVPGTNYPKVYPSMASARAVLAAPKNQGATTQ